MPYSTVSELSAQYGYREVSELLWDEESDITEPLYRDAVLGNDLSVYSAAEQAAVAIAIARVNTMLNQQSIKIDTYIGAAYELPIADASITPLGECCMALTRVALSDDGDNLAKHLLDERTYWFNWLKSLAKAETILQGATRLAAGEVGGVDHKRLTATPNSCVDFSKY